MAEVELAAGTIEYEDTGGEGETLVFVPGLMLDHRQWERVVAELRGEFRCVSVDMPLGAHRRPMRPDADLSLAGLARILATFLDAAGLEDVTLCFNDWSGGQTMVAEGLTDRVARLVLVSVETVGNYPPGLAGKAAWLSAKVPGGIRVGRRVMLNRSLARSPFVLGAMAKHGIPEEILRHCLEPLSRPEIRRDLARYAGDAIPAGRRTLRDAQERLGDFEGPVLVVWDSEGKMMPHEEGVRLAGSFPDSTFVEIPDCYTLIPLDSPAALAATIRDFVTTGRAGSRSA